MKKDYVEIKFNEKVIFVAGIKKADASEYFKDKVNALKNLSDLIKNYDQRIYDAETRILKLELQLKLDHGEITKEEYEKEIAKL